MSNFLGWRWNKFHILYRAFAGTAAWRVDAALAIPLEEHCASVPFHAVCFRPAMGFAGARGCTGGHWVPFQTRGLLFVSQFGKHIDTSLAGWLDSQFSTYYACFCATGMRYVLGGLAVMASLLRSASVVLLHEVPVRFLHSQSRGSRHHRHRYRLPCQPRTHACSFLDCLRAAALPLPLLPVGATQPSHMAVPWCS